MYEHLRLRNHIFLWNSFPEFCLYKRDYCHGDFRYYYHGYFSKFKDFFLYIQRSWYCSHTNLVGLLTSRSGYLRVRTKTIAKFSGYGPFLLGTFLWKPNSKRIPDALKNLNFFRKRVLKRRNMRDIFFEILKVYLYMIDCKIIYWMFNCICL